MPAERKLSGMSAVAEDRSVAKTTRAKVAAPQPRQRRTGLGARIGLPEPKMLSSQAAMASAKKTSAGFAIATVRQTGVTAIPAVRRNLETLLILLGATAPKARAPEATTLGVL